ncbi:MAG: IPT/TIG domain-containing protein [Candidatus Obscuribacterales bacterium]|nr:IPT/TIG domain-containing protein [Candidatus Obscuribacterales bacterium]
MSIDNLHGLLLYWVLIPFLLNSAATVSVFAATGSQNAAQSQINYDYVGDMTHAAQIPCGFGPFKAKSSNIGVYRGRVQVFKDDLKGQPLYLVVRIHEDKNHSFGWLRAYVNKQLVATEADLKESRIVAELTKVLAPGYADISIMGAAYPGTSMDFYVVAKDFVLTAIQGKPLGKVLYAVGPIKTSGKQEEEFSNSFELTSEEAKARLLLSLRLFSSHLGKARLYINGQLLATEKDFSPEGQTSLELTGRASEGLNKIVMRGDAAAGTAAAWFLMQMPVQREETRGGLNSPEIVTVSPPDELNAGETIKIRGRNFGEDLSNVRVMLDDMLLSAQFSSKDELAVQIPADLNSGRSNLFVEVAEQSSDEFPITIAGFPHVSGTSVLQCPAGYEFIIYGKNFSESIEKVKVTIGGRLATVIAASKQGLLVRMPLPEENGKIENDLKVQVSVGKLESKDNVVVKSGKTPIRTAKVVLPLLLPTRVQNDQAFEEKVWRSLMEKAEQSANEGSFESSEFYLMAAADEASKSKSVTQFLTDSLNGLAECYRKQGLTEDVKQCQEVIQAISGGK